MTLRGRMEIVASGGEGIVGTASPLSLLPQVPQVAVVRVSRDAPAALSSPDRSRRRPGVS